MASTRQEIKREFLEKYVQLCLKYDTYVEGCGCNIYLADLDDNYKDLLSGNVYDETKESFLKDVLEAHLYENT